MRQKCEDMAVKYAFGRIVGAWGAHSAGVPPDQNRSFPGCAGWGGPGAGALFARQPSLTRRATHRRATTRHADAPRSHADRLWAAIRLMPVGR